MNCSFKRVKLLISCLKHGWMFLTLCSFNPHNRFIDCIDCHVLIDIGMDFKWFYFFFKHQICEVTQKQSDCTVLIKRWSWTGVPTFFWNLSERLWQWRWLRPVWGVQLRLTSGNRGWLGGFRWTGDSIGLWNSLQTPANERGPPSDLDLTPGTPGSRAEEEEQEEWTRGLVWLEGGVHGTGIGGRMVDVGEMRAALPPGFGQDSVEEARRPLRSRGGASRSCRRHWGPTEAERAADAVLPEQLWGAATAERRESHQVHVSQWKQPTHIQRALFYFGPSAHNEFPPKFSLCSRRRSVPSKIHKNLTVCLEPENLTSQEINYRETKGQQIKASDIKLKSH